VILVVDVPTDTDSISFCKPDGLPFTNQELLVLMDEIAFLSPEYMDWDLEGVFSSCLAIKAKYPKPNVP